MINQNHTPEELYESYLQGTCNDDEKRLVEEWYNNISASAEHKETTEINFENFRTAIWNELPAAKQVKVKKHIYQRIFNPLPITIAASLLICVGLSFYHFSSKNVNNVQISKNDSIAPGGNKAYLTLSNGERVLLNNEASINISDQNGVLINKTADGQLIYTISNKENGSSNRIVPMNKIETPKGGQFQVVLPDGTKVWLNSASSLKYPANFSKLKERSVELQGEAYFEVAHKDNLTFKVMTGAHEVKVLGTHFNVMAYPEEQAIYTTLLQGSVKVSQGNLSRMVKPGEESIVNEKTNSITVEKADLDKVMAWKNGRFEFDNSDLPEIMRQLSRWYDVTIDYRLTTNPGKFGGGISKDQTLEEVLKLIEGNGICHFKVEGRKVIVLP